MGGVVFAMQGHDAPDTVRVRSYADAEKIDNIPPKLQRQNQKKNQSQGPGHVGKPKQQQLNQKMGAHGPKQNGQPRSQTTQRAAVAEPFSGYTSAEKAWLKKGWDNEFKFLRAYGLNNHKREDRIEGRQLLQGFMEDDQAKNRAQASRQEPQIHFTGFSIGHGARYG